MATGVVENGSVQSKPERSHRMTAVWVFVLVSVGLLLGKIVRLLLPPLRRYFIPSSIIGGLIALMGGPEVWGRLVAAQPGGLAGQEVYDYCGMLPGFLISIVFAALFLGKRIPPVREVWRRAGPQVAFGQAIAWGMYAVGLGLTVTVLTPLFHVPPMFGTLLEIGFEGGHGTAAGLSETFRAAGWPEGSDLALGVATVGVVMGVVLGMILVNWGVRRGHTVFLTRAGTRVDVPPAMPDQLAGRDGDDREPSSVAGEAGSPPNDTAGAAGEAVFEIRSIEPLSLHVAYIGVAIGVGAVLLFLLQQAEAQTLGRLGIDPLLDHMPLFPLAMIGGMIVQQLHDRLLPRLSLQRSLFMQLQGLALDYLIVAALASLSLRALMASWQPLVILLLAGIAWIVGMFLILGPRMLPDYWFERGIGDLGQSLGMTATGLLLMKIVDSEYRSPAYEAFGYKQLLFEPFVGGGVVTAMAVPLVFRFGPWPLLIVSGIVTASWIAVGVLYFGRAKNRVETPS
jgi:glutamate:Na+ symporter, ESS family